MIYSAVATSKGVNEGLAWPEDNSHLSFLDAVVIATVTTPKIVSVILSEVEQSIGYSITPDALSSKLLRLEEHKLIEAVRELTPETRIEVRTPMVTVTCNYGALKLNSLVDIAIVEYGLLHYGMFVSTPLALGIKLV